MIKVTTVLILSWLFLCSILYSQPAAEFSIARLKYSGGGDWYNDPSSLPNMLEFLRNNALISAAEEEAQVSIMDEEFFSHPLVFMTGHGRVVFSEQEVERMRAYLTNGGFLYADDDYGMDEHFRREFAKVFPDKELVEIPFSHPIFHIHYEFANGLPKIHEHDGGPPKAFGYFHKGRLVVFYSFNTNISDGWPNPDVHQDPESVRQSAFRMGTNIITFALTQ